MRLARYGTPLSGHSGFTRGSLLAFAGWLVLAFASCADAGAPDGFVTDGGATVFDGSPVSPPNDREDPDFDAGACFDGLDNDDDGTLDCAEAECGVRAECCVGSAECCSGATRLSTLTVECEDGPASACDSLEGLTLFGAPTIERTGLVPQGGAGHGGGAPQQLCSGGRRRRCDRLRDALAHPPAPQFDAAGAPPERRGGRRA